MTTTISRQEMQQQQQQQQQQEQHLLQQQQHLQQQQQQQQLQQQQQHLQQQHLQQQQQYVQLQQQHQSYFSLQQQQQQHLPSSSNSSEVVASGSGLGPADLQFDSLNNNNNGSSEQPMAGATDTQKRRSLLNFKSLDFHLKSLYSGLRSHSSSGGGGPGAGASQPNSSAPAVDQVQRRMPYLRVESVDPEGEPAHRRGGPEAALSGHSPSFLSPYSGAGGAGGGGAVSLQLPSADAATIRRSSTSDIVNCRKGAGGGAGTGGAGAGGGGGSAQDSRRPSTSDLLRKARERKGSEARMGRSVSHTGLTRGGAFGGGGGLGGRRTSMAF